ncbi:RAMP superfamily CRISPR-associated protein [Caldibacillus thermoamylovorans]|uniref:RAMP superfamily CRISPR-associated protein n=1 Tax=Caldibacillus thermoamylovorans TaxID=35841 RepID=UPI00137523DE|nr:RAMP superfamily CRISPR-associated protein [Caldibacillus thermoamylovorans]
MRHVFEWNFELRTESPLRIGDNEGDLLLDADGKPFLPGTSLAGACRSYVEEVFGSDVANELFGKIGDELRPSRLIFSDGVCRTTQSYFFQPRIALDGKSKTVQSGMFERVTVSSGSVFPVMLVLKTSCEEDKEVVEDMLAALNEGTIRIGADKSIGGGKVSIVNGYFVHYDCSKRQELFNYVNEMKKKTVWSPQKNDGNRGVIRFIIKGQTASPLLVAGQNTFDSDQADRIYMKINKDGTERAIIPASSFKGVLRHRIQRIANIMQLKEKETYVTELFGSESEEHTKRSGNLLLEDTFVEQEKSKTYYRIQINPLTGSVKNGALLDMKTVQGSFTTLLIYRLKKGREMTTEDKVALALLLFALRDLGMQQLTVGSGASIGWGYLDILSIHVQFADGNVLFNFRDKQIKDESHWLEKLQKALDHAKESVEV